MLPSVSDGSARNTPEDAVKFAPDDVQKSLTHQIIFTM
jgi:hypothetical protein